jgi:ribonuclease P protein component
MTAILMNHADCSKTLQGRCLQYNRSMPDDVHSYKFPRNAHLRSSADFDRVFAAHNRAGDRIMSLYALPNQLPLTRLGIAVGVKYGNAVRRNRIKRRIREAFRLMRHELQVGLDLVVLPRPGHCPKPIEIQDSFRKLIPQLLGKAGVHPP